MFTFTFHPRPFLRRLYGTQAFLEYCDSRNIPFPQRAGATMSDADFHKWVQALGQLDEPEQARVNLELGQVHEMARPDAADLLLTALRPRALPPEDVPGPA